MNNTIIAGITHGDINGIGYEIIINTLIDNRIYEVCTPIVYGSAKAGAYHRKALNVENFSFNNIKSPEEANHKRTNLINCVSDENLRVELGKSTQMAGESSFIALEAAVNDALAGKIDVLITAPINKHNIYSDKFKFPGHTEYLQEKFKVNEVLMLMVNEVMRVGVVTGHVPISRVASLITEELIISKLIVMNNSLIEDFGIRKPRIAVLGLNPHAGDNGIIGDEEEKIITPAMEKAKDLNIMAFGPFPADGFFGSSSFTKFDGILAMYHDQGLAPFKALSYEGGVNFTAGLPFVRTSPAHGTAYEIAGKGEASLDSFRKAVYLAVDIFNNRKMYKELNKNPLKTNHTNEPDR